MDGLLPLLVSLVMEKSVPADRRHTTGFLVRVFPVAVSGIVAALERYWGLGEPIISPARIAQHCRCS